MLDALAAQGIRWFRFDLDWAAAQPEPGRFDWSVPDRIVDWAGRRGTSLLAVLAYAPRWAWAAGEKKAHEDDDGQVPARVEDWVHFVEATVRRYGRRIQAYSLWNEPNVGRFWHGGRQRYVEEILLPGLDAVRRTQEDAVVVGPDLSSTGQPLRDWLSPILESGARFDVLSHHQYDGKDSVGGRLRAIDELQQLRVGRGLGSLPLWITEIGFRVPSETSDHETQAQALADVLEAMMTRPWWHKTFWFDSHGPGWGLFEGEGMEERAALGRYGAVAHGVTAVLHKAATLLGAVLGREAVEREVRAVVTAARIGTPELAAAILAREDVQARLAELDPPSVAQLLYRGLFGREADPGGLDATAEAVRGGRLVERVAAMLDDSELLRARA
jgi:hypothetical protein